MPLPNNKRRSTRLRKKLHLGEFRECGFRFETVIDPSLSPAQIEAAVDALLEEVVAPRGLGMGGWLSGAYIVSMEGKTATDDDRAAFQQWLEARPEIQSVSVLPLSNAWYADLSHAA